MKSSMLLLVSAFLISTAGYTQVHSGKVIYKLEYQRNVQHYIDSVYKEDSFLKSFTFKRLMNEKKSAPYITYSLEFTSEESRFDTQPIMASDNGLDIESTAEYATTHGGVFYTNLSQNIGLNQFESMGQEVLMQSDLDSLHWTIGKETKIIQGYTCRKATAIINMNAVSKGMVTAWFAPKLPFQFGPMGMAGLPGLILGFKHKQYYFYASKIKLSSKKRTIERPTKGTFMTANQFYGGIRTKAKEMFGDD